MGQGEQGGRHAAFRPGREMRVERRVQGLVRRAGGLVGAGHPEQEIRLGGGLDEPSTAFGVLVDAGRVDEVQHGALGGVQRVHGQSLRGGQMIDFGLERLGERVDEGGLAGADLPEQHDAQRLGGLRGARLVLAHGAAAVGGELGVGDLQASAVEIDADLGDLLEHEALEILLQRFAGLVEDAVGELIADLPDRRADRVGEPDEASRAVEPGQPAGDLRLSVAERHQRGDGDAVGEGDVPHHHAAVAIARDGDHLQELRQREAEARVRLRTVVLGGDRRELVGGELREALPVGVGGEGALDGQAAALPDLAVALGPVGAFGELLGQVAIVLVGGAGGRRLRPFGQLPAKPATGEVDEHEVGEQRHREPADEQRDQRALPPERQQGDDEETRRRQHDDQQGVPERPVGGAAEAGEAPGDAAGGAAVGAPGGVPERARDALRGGRPGSLHPLSLRPGRARFGTPPAPGPSALLVGGSAHDSRCSSKARRKAACRSSVFTSSPATRP